MSLKKIFPLFWTILFIVGSFTLVTAKDTIQKKLDNVAPSDIFFVEGTNDSLIYFQVVFFDSKKRDSLPIFYGKVPLEKSLVSDSLGFVLNDNILNYFDHKNLKYIAKEELQQLHEAEKILRITSFVPGPDISPAIGRQQTLMNMFFRTIEFVATCGLFFFLFTLVDSGKKRFANCSLDGKVLIVFSITLLIQLFFSGFILWSQPERVLSLFAIMFLQGLAVLLLFHFYEKKYRDKYAFGEYQISLLLYAIFVGIITILGTQSIWQQIDSGGVPRGLGRVMVSHEAIGNFTTLFAFLTAQLFYARKNHTRQRTLLQKEIEITQLNELRTKAELETLTAKTNPHFLYNSLNTIAALAKVDANKTQKMAIELSDFLKYSTNRKEQLLVSLAEEIRIVQTYLSIEKIRFQDQLSFQIQVDESAEKQLVPRFLLQPLVENAIKHGYRSASTSVQLLVLVTINNGLLTIKVADSGADFKDDFIPGHGLDSVSKKLQLLFPNRHTFAFINRPNKHIRITLECGSQPQ